MVSCRSRHCGFSFAINFQALFYVQGRVSSIGHDADNTLFFKDHFSVIVMETLLFLQTCSFCPILG